MANDDRRVTVVAQLRVMSEGRTETIKSFDKAWHRALELPVPVTILFDDFVRID